jgi:tRNA threonylcarbamoyl adenosine modification protein YeaZ
VILGIDTSLGTAVAVIDDDGLVLAEASSPDPLGHAELIGDLLATALGDAALGPVGSTAPAAPVVPTHVAAGMGPGPFTGLRVGIAAARAFALGRSLPVIPVVSHDAIALSILLDDAIADEPAGRFAVVTDARRREYAYSLYEGIDDDGLPIRVGGPALAPRDDIDGLLADRGFTRRDAHAVSAAMVALVAARALASGRVDMAAHEPLYLRAPDVTISRGPKRVTG